jgi:hypothetical protein
VPPPQAAWLVIVSRQLCGLSAGLKMDAAQPFEATSTGNCISDLYGPDSGRHLGEVNLDGQGSSRGRSGLDPKFETPENRDTLQRTGGSDAGAQVLRVSSIFVKFDKIRSILSFWGHWQRCVLF